VDQRHLKEALVAALYAAGTLSERQAREALGMTRRAFQEMLPRFNLPVLADTPGNLAAELRA
jgi:hypothetical protein